MSRKSIVVNLPEVDSTTSKRKKVVHDYFIIKSNLEMRHGIVLEFTEDDGSPIAHGNELQRLLFLPKQIIKETDGKLVDPLTGVEVPPGTPNAITELAYWQNIALISFPGINAMSNEIKDALKDIKISDLVYWLMEQSILKGNAEGKY